MIATVAQGMSGWVWTSPGVRVYGPLHGESGLDRGQHAAPCARPPAGRGRHDRAVESPPRHYFDVQAAIDAAAICNDCVTKMVGAGSETQFEFRGTLQEEKPLRDWLQEVLMNCLGYYTFSFGKLKIGIRENSSDGRGVHGRATSCSAPPTGSGQAVVQPSDRQLRGPGLRVREQQRGGLRHRPRLAAWAAARVRCT